MTLQRAIDLAVEAANAKSLTLGSWCGLLWSVPIVLGMHTGEMAMLCALIFIVIGAASGVFVSFVFRLLRDR